MASEAISFPADSAQPSCPISSRTQAIRNHLPSRRISAIRRRPDSVFSRRGIDSPVQPVEPFTMRFATTKPHGQQRTPSKRWKIRKAQSPTSEQRGTILRAVPRSSDLSSLPSDMQSSATPSIPSIPDSISHAVAAAGMDLSPNEEILLNIGRTSPPSATTPPANAPFYHSHRSLPRSFAFPKLSPTSPKKERKCWRKSEGDSTTIGFWRNGKAHWEGGPPVTMVQRPEDAFANEPDSKHLRLETPAREMTPARRNQRPKIQVIIPEERRRSPFDTQGRIGPPPAQPPPPPAPAKPRRYTVEAIVPVYLEKVQEQTSNTPEHWPSVSSSSNRSFRDKDAGYGSSNYSGSNSGSSRTSITSLEDNGELLKPQPTFLGGSRTGSRAYSIITPAAAGIFDDATPAVTASQPASPVELSIALSAEPEGQDTPASATLRPRANSSSLPELARTTTVSRRNSRRNPRICLSECSVAGGTEKDAVPHVTPPSPTLSEAETALEKHLTSIRDSNPHDVSTARSPPGATLLAPPLPPKSSRRNRVASLPAGSTWNHVGAHQVRTRSVRLPPVSPPVSPSASFLKKRVPRQRLTLVIPNTNTTAKHVTLRPTSPAPPARHISTKAAETIVRSILVNTHSLDDLFNTALVNKGFHRIFRRNQLALMKDVLRRQSAPAWERREACPPYDKEGEGKGKKSEPDSAYPRPDYTAKTYFHHYKKDAEVISALKSLVLSRCQTFLRPETVMALTNADPERAARMDDAFWRIWNFCEIFGGGKGREDDITGQTDWLRGGPLVHQAGCRATILSGDSIDDSGTLLNASEHFAKGNPGGLSAEQLYDMTEIWTCLSVLVSVLEGHTDQARRYGVFDATDVRGGDIDGEELMLQEWMYYILTLGLRPILALASSSIPFHLAATNGWTLWAPPAFEGSRACFLKEAVARVYEEKIAAMASGANAAVANKLEMREVSRQRIAAHRAEIRQRRREGDYHTVRMSMERPISEWEDVFSALGARTPSPAPSGSASLRSTMGMPRGSRMMEMRLPDLPELEGSASPDAGDVVAASNAQARVRWSGGRRESRGQQAQQYQQQQQQYSQQMQQQHQQQHQQHYQTLSEEKEFGGPLAAPEPSELHPALRSAVELDADMTPVSAPSYEPILTATIGGQQSDAFAPSTAYVHPALRTTTATSTSQSQAAGLGVRGTMFASSGHPTRQQTFFTSTPSTVSLVSGASGGSDARSRPSTASSGIFAPRFHQRETFMPPQQQMQMQTQGIGGYKEVLPQQHQSHHQNSRHRHHHYQQQQNRPRTPSTSSSLSVPTPKAAEEDLALTSPERAIAKITEMGFSVEQAKYALRKTDLGDGLRVERAVEVLLGL